MRTIASCLLLVCSVLLTSCSKHDELYRHTVLVFGTLVEISISGGDEALADSAFLELERSLLGMHAQWTPWEETSDLSRVNHAIRAGEVFDMPDSIGPLVERSKRYYELSDGLYNPAIGQLIRLWQFHRHEDPELMPPGASMIHSFLEQAPAITDVERGDPGWSSRNRMVELNFGAFAKGVAIERAVDSLRAMGIDNAIVNAGGDLAAIGRNTAADPPRPWNIGIRHPRTGGVLASIEVADGEAVFTSGDYERNYTRDGRRYHHVLDPRTGYPSEGATSVTVIDDDAGKADAAATALLIAGSADWERIAGNFGLDHVMLVDAGGRVHVSRAMAGRVRFEVAPEPVTIVSDTL